MRTHHRPRLDSTRFGVRTAVRCAVAASLIASVVPAAAATPAIAPRALATTSDAAGLAGWTAVGSSSPCPWAVVRPYTTDTVCHTGYGFQEPQNADGRSFFSTDFERPTADAPADATLSRTLTVRPGTGRSRVHWLDFISWDLSTYGARLPRVASVELRDASGAKILRTLSRQTLRPGTADLDTSTWTAHSVDISGFAGCEVTLVFHLRMPEVASGPATYSLDGVGVDSSTHSANAAQPASRLCR